MRLWSLRHGTNSAEHNRIIPMPIEGVGRRLSGSPLAVDQGAYRAVPQADSVPGRIDAFARLGMKLFPVPTRANPAVFCRVFH